MFLAHWARTAASETQPGSIRNCPWVGNPRMPKTRNFRLEEGMPPSQARRSCKKTLAKQKIPCKPRLQEQKRGFFFRVSSYNPTGRRGPPLSRSPKSPPVGLRLWSRAEPQPRTEPRTEPQRPREPREPRMPLSEQRALRAVRAAAAPRLVVQHGAEARTASASQEPRGHPRRGKPAARRLGG